MTELDEAEAQDRAAGLDGLKIGKLPRETQRRMMNGITRRRS